MKPLDRNQVLELLQVLLENMASTAESGEMQDGEMARLMRDLAFVAHAHRTDTACDHPKIREAAADVCNSLKEGN